MVGSHRIPSPLWKNIRTGSVGIEIFSAVTLLLLALAKVIDPNATSSVIVLLLNLHFPGLWLSLIFVLGLLHLYALRKPSIRPWTGIRKGCSVVGFAAYVGIIYDVLVVRPNAGAVIWLGLIAVFLLVAIFRVDYAP